MTVRIANRILECEANYHAGEQNADVEITISPQVTLTDEDIFAIKDAKVLEEITYDGYNKPVVCGIYNLVGWKYIKTTRFGVCFGWQTYRTTDLDVLKEENETLTEAILELAQIVGGGNG